MGLRVNIEDRIVPSFLRDRLQGVAAWRIAGLTLAIALLALIVTYGQTFAKLVLTWAHSATFNHCFLIPPVSLYLVWRNRARLLAATPSPDYFGIPILLAAGAVWLVGHAADVDFVEEIALVPMIFALHLTVLGSRATRTNFFPLAYLILAVPMGEALIPPLQTFTADSAVLLLRAVGVPAFLEGTYISIPNGSYVVAEACAGLRFLVATVTLGVLFAYLYYRSPWRWLAFLALSFVLPVVANAIRAFGIILIGYRAGTDVAGGVDHIITGWIFFAVVTVLFLAIGYSFSDRKAETDEGERGDWQPADIAGLAPRQVLSAALVAVVFAVIPPTYEANLDENAPAPKTAPVIAAPAVSEPWRLADSVDADWLPRYAGLDATVLKSYQDADGHTVDLFIGYYARQRAGSELIGYGNAIANADFWRVVNDDSVSARLWSRVSVVREAAIDHGEVRRLVRYWYWVDGEFTANPYWAKLLFARSKLFGGIQGAAVIAVGAAYESDAGAARARIGDFLAHVAPIGEALKASGEHAARK